MGWNSDYDPWDLVLRRGALGQAELRMVVEHHGGPRRVARFAAENPADRTNSRPPQMPRTWSGAPPGRRQSAGNWAASRGTTKTKQSADADRTRSTVLAESCQAALALWNTHSMTRPIRTWSGARAYPGGGTPTPLYRSGKLAQTVLYDYYV